MSASKPVILLLALMLELVRIGAGETNYFLVGEAAAFLKIAIAIGRFEWRIR
jgi:hypothetical protein